MNLEKGSYESEGLKIDQERVLTYSQLSCPFECKYCFVEDMNFNQEKDVAYLTENQIRLLEQLPEEIKLIMLGCDTEFFQSEEDSLRILRRLSDLSRDIAIVTKLGLSKDFLAKIKEIDLKLRENGNFLSLSVLIPCMGSYKKWESKAPTPQKRIRTLKNAKDQGVETMVAIRPLLPDVSAEELKEIVESTRDYCFGYYSGPLYLKNLSSDLVDKDDGNLSIEKIQPHWMPQGHDFYMISRNGQMEILEGLIRDSNRSLFDGASDGVKFLRKKYEKH